MGQASAEWVHTVTECAKLAFADREAWYGDPDFADVPLADLLSRDYAEERRGLLGEEASPELRPGSPGGREPRLAHPVEDAPVAPGVGEPTRGDTVHLDVVDRSGNMVSATPSGGWLWGAPVIPSLGFCLGTRAQMFWLEEGLPNSLEPGKRPRTTLSPTLAARGGEPCLALGTPGGDQQDQWTLHVFLAHVHHGLDLQAAIDAPNHHTEAFPSSFYPRETPPAARRGRGARRHRDDRRAARARARRRGVGPVDARPRHRRRARARRDPEGRREPARQAGLRRGPLTSIDHPDGTMPRTRAAGTLRPMDDNDFGLKFWLKIAGLFVLGAIGLFVFMWIFLSAIYAWGFFAAFLVLAVGALALGWLHDRRNAGPQEGSY